MIFWISFGVLLIGVGIMVWEKNTNSCSDVVGGTFALGVILILAAIFVGFGLTASVIPVKNLPPIYLEPSSAFFDEKCIVAVLNEQRYYTNVAVDVNKAKNGLIKISQIKQYNSYNIELVPSYSLVVFSKEEWEKINPEIKLEK